MFYELGPAGAPKVFNDVQPAPAAKPDVADKWISVPADVGDVRVRQAIHVLRKAFPSN